MLRTVHLTNAWHATSGGIATFYRALLRTASNHPAHAMALVVPGDDDGVEAVAANARIYSVRSPRAPVNSSYRLIMPWEYLSPAGRVRRILDAERPDLVEIGDKYTLPYLGGLLRINMLPGYPAAPAVIGISHERMDENLCAYWRNSRLVPLFSRWYMKWIYFPQCDHHLANSMHTAGELRAASCGHKVRRGVWVRPMGVDLRDFSPGLRSPEWRKVARTLFPGARHDCVFLFYAGRLVPEKNLPLLIEVMEQLSKDERDFRLLIAGDGISREPFERSCRERVPGRVRFTGHLSAKHTLAEHYANCDVFLHPNPREPFGIGPLEAMASGLPVVAPDQGGVITYLNQRNGWPTPPDAHSFAAAIDEVLRDPVQRAARIAVALDTARQYDWDHVAAGFLQLYRDLYAATKGVARDSFATPPDFLSTPGNFLGQSL